LKVEDEEVEFDGDSFAIRAAGDKWARPAVTPYL
jgi:hypothetical protein